MDNYLVIAVIIESTAIVVILLVLSRALLKIKRDYLLLNNIVDGNRNDIAGLCSAALVVDKRISDVVKQIDITDLQLKDLKIVETEQTSTHAYSIDIKKVRSGAGVNELMQSSGLSHDEAALLIRLHGSKMQHQIN